MTDLERQQVAKTTEREGMARAVVAERVKTTDQEMNRLPMSLFSLVSKAAEVAGLPDRELWAMYEAEIRDLLAGRLVRVADLVAAPNLTGEVPPAIPSLLDRLKERSHAKLEAELGKLLEPMAGK